MKCLLCYQKRPVSSFKLCRSQALICGACRFQLIANFGFGAAGLLGALDRQHSIGGEEKSGKPES
jgi:hypothetical protein